MTFDARLVSGIGVLAAVVEAGSFVRAGEALGLTQSGVSRAIARLEERISVRLLDRTTRCVSLTGEGRAFYEQVGPLMAGIEEAATRASGASIVVRGRLRVNVDPFLSRLVLAPHLPALLLRYPDLTLELLTREQLGDLVADGFDLALRFGEPPSTGMMARKITDTRILTVAAPSLLARYGRPSGPDALVDLPCIQFRDPITGRPFDWEFRRGGRILPVKTSGNLLLTDVATMLEACMAGVGVAQVMAIGVLRLLEEGRLIELFPDWPGETFPLYALYPSRHLMPAKVQVFIDFAVEAIHERMDVV